MDFLDTNGSYEATVADLTDAADRWLAEALPDVPLDAWVEATYSDRLVMGVGSGDHLEFWEVPYAIADEVVTFGTPTDLEVVGATTDAPVPGGEMQLDPAEKVIASSLSTKNMTRIRRRLLLLRAYMGAMHEAGLDGTELPDQGDYLDFNGEDNDDEKSLKGWNQGVYFLDGSAEIAAPYSHQVKELAPDEPTILEMLIESMTQEPGEKSIDPIVTAAAAFLVEAKSGDDVALMDAFDTLGTLLMERGLIGEPAEGEEGDTEDLEDDGTEDDPEVSDFEKSLAAFNEMKTAQV